jgi:hypothetical protein
MALGKRLKRVPALEERYFDRVHLDGAVGAGGVEPSESDYIRIELR